MFSFLSSSEAGWHEGEYRVAREDLGVSLEEMGQAMVYQRMVMK